MHRPGTFGDQKDPSNSTPPAQTQRLYFFSWKHKHLPHRNKASSAVRDPSLVIPFPLLTIFSASLKQYRKHDHQSTSFGGRGNNGHRLIRWTGWNQRFRPHWTYCLPQCVSSGILGTSWTRLTIGSVEHEEIDIVACNDPFIEPHYAVSCNLSHVTLLERMCRLTSYKSRPTCSSTTPPTASSRVRLRSTART